MKQKRFHTFEREQEQLLRFQRYEYFGIPFGQFDGDPPDDYEKQSYLDEAHHLIFLGKELPQELEDKLYKYGLGVGRRENHTDIERRRHTLYRW